MNSMSATPQFAAHNENAAGFEVVTDAFGYTGGAIARKLQASGRSVRTLTGHPNRPEVFGGALQVGPLDFDDPACSETLKARTSSITPTGFDFRIAG